MSKLPLDSPPIEREARIIKWLERDDGVTTAEAAQFFSWDDYCQLPEAVIQKVTASTKLGGPPAWIQSPDEAPKNGWRFVGQLDSTYSFLDKPAVSVDGVNEDKERWEGRSHWCVGPNLGDGGIAYLFLRDKDPVPEGWFFWQCS